MRVTQSSLKFQYLLIFYNTGKYITLCTETIIRLTEYKIMTN